MAGGSPAPAAPSLGKASTSTLHPSLRTRLRKRRSILVRRLKPKNAGAGGEAVTTVFHEHVHHHHLFGHPVPHAHHHGHSGHHHGGHHTHEGHGGHHAQAHAAHAAAQTPATLHHPAPRRPLPAIAVSVDRPARPATPAAISAPPTPEPPLLPRTRTPLGFVRRRGGKDRAVSEPLNSLFIPEPSAPPSAASSLRSATPALPASSLRSATPAPPHAATSSLRSPTPAPSIGHRRTLSNKMLSLINGIVARRGSNKDDKSPLSAVLLPSPPPAPAPPAPPATPPASILSPRVPPARPHRSPDTASFITSRAPDPPSPALVAYTTPHGVFEARTEMPDPRPFGRARREPPADLVSHFSDSTQSSGILSLRRRRTRRPRHPLSSNSSIRRAHSRTQLRRSPTSFQYSVGSSKSSSFRVPWHRRPSAPGAGLGVGLSDDSRRSSGASALSSSALASIQDDDEDEPLSPPAAPPFAAPPSPPTPSRRVSSAARHASHASARIRTPPLDRIKVWSQSMPDLAHQQQQRQRSQTLRLRKPRANKKGTIRRRRSSLDL